MAGNVPIKQEKDKQDVKQSIKEIKNKLKGISEDSKAYASLQKQLGDLYFMYLYFYYSSLPVIFYYASDSKCTEAIVHYKIADVKLEESRNFEEQADVLGKLAKCYLGLARYLQVITNKHNNNQII